MEFSEIAARALTLPKRKVLASEVEWIGAALTALGIGYTVMNVDAGVGRESVDEEVWIVPHVTGITADVLDLLRRFIDIPGMNGSWDNDHLVLMSDGSGHIAGGKHLVDPVKLTFDTLSQFQRKVKEAELAAGVVKE